MNDDSLGDTTPVIGLDFGRNPSAVLAFKPRAVTPKVTEPKDAIIELLEDYLESAKAGKIQFLAVATIDDRGVAFSTWEPEVDNSPQLITSSLGAVSYLNFRFNQACAAGAEPDTSLRPE
jgi:hypothetical protein